MNSNLEKIERNNLCCKTSFAQQTETNLFTYLPIHLFTSNKLDCFTSVRNDEKPQTVTNFASYRPNVLTTSNKLDCHARPADSGNGARNDVTTLVPFKKVAFTLAEVLITLGIIGVVAAMTMPSLIQNYKDMVLVNQAKKSYTNFLNVLKRMQAENGYTNYEDMFSGSTRLQVTENIAKYYNGSVVCTAANKGCGSDYGVKLSTPTNNGFGGVAKENFSFPRINNIDGSSIYIREVNNDCVLKLTQQKKDENGFYITGEYKTFTDTNRCALVIIDVNGQSKGPNQYGADVHQIHVKKNRLDDLGGLYGNIYTIFINNKLDYTKYSDDYEF